MGCLILRLWIFSTSPANQSRCRADPFFLHEFPTIPMTPSRGLVPAYQIFCVGSGCIFLPLHLAALSRVAANFSLAKAWGKASKVPLELNLGRVLRSLVPDHWVDTSQINSQTVN